MRVVVEMPRFTSTEYPYVVVEIHVAIGDLVMEGDVVMTVETDKVHSEVPSPAAGTIQEILVAVEDEVAAGEPIVVIHAD